MSVEEVKKELKDAKNQCDEALEEAREINNQKSISHEESILYQKDVATTIETINALKSLIGSLYARFTHDISLSERSISTTVNMRTDSLQNISVKFSSTDSLDDVIEKIKDASSKVYDEKSQEYQSNVDVIETNKSEFENSYGLGVKKIHEAEHYLFQAQEEGRTKRKELELKEKAESCLQEAKNYCGACKHYVENINKNNEKNKELLEKFLKRS